MSEKEDEGKDKVRDLGEARRRKATGEAKPAKGLVHRILSEQILGITNYFTETYPHKYHVYSPDKSSSLIFEEAGGQVFIISKDYLADQVLKYCAGIAKRDAMLNLTAQDFREVARMVIGRATKLEKMPAAFCFQDWPELSFRRLGFSPNEDEFERVDLWNDPQLVAEYPILQLFERCSHPLELAAWLGGLFYSESYLQQYCYLYGPGGCGKSSLLRLLQHIMGTAYHADSLDEAGGRFWTHSFLGRRLVAFPDTNYTSFTATGRIKALTGGDAVRIEIKNGACFSQPLDCKFMFLSNGAPEMVMDEASRRRAVVVKVEGLTKERTIKYEREIMEPKQVQFFVDMCMASYRQLCPDHEEIRQPKSTFMDLADDIEEDIEAFWTSRLEISSSDAIPYSELMAVLDAGRVTSRTEKRRHIKWLTEHWGLGKARVDITKNSRPLFILGAAKSERDPWEEKNRQLWERAASAHLPHINTGGYADL